MSTLTAEQKTRKAANDAARRKRNKEALAPLKLQRTLDIKRPKPKAVNSPLASVAKVLKGHGGKRKDSGKEKATDNKSKEAYVVVSFRGSKAHKDKASRLGAAKIREWLDSQAMPRK